MAYVDYLQSHELHMHLASCHLYKCDINLLKYMYPCKQVKYSTDTLSYGENINNNEIMSSFDKRAYFIRFYVSVKFFLCFLVFNNLVNVHVHMSALYTTSSF